MSLNNNVENILVPEDIYGGLMAFFNAIDEVFFSVDLINYKFIKISDGCEKLFGYKPADFLSKGGLFFELVHPDDRSIAANADLKLQQGIQSNSEYRIIHKSGSIKWIEKKVLPYLNESGKIVKAEGIIRDITARKVAEEKNQANEASYRQIVEISQEGIWTIDEHDKTNFVNQKMADILGYKPEEMIGKEPNYFMFEKDKAASVERLKKRHAGAVENLDIRYVSKSGQEIWTNMSANPIFNAIGEYRGTLAMVTDITQRKLDEEAIKKSEANLRTLFDNTDSSYILISNQLEIVSFNALAQRYSEEQNNRSLVANKSIKEYFSTDRWEFIETIIEKVATGQTIKYELSYTKNDGSVHWYRVRWLNVKDSAGKSCGFILANKEITEAKVATLERERITNDLIRHNKDLEQFTYIISHNLRAPVANIIGLSEILQDDDMETDSRREVIDRIATSTKNIDAVILDLNTILQARHLLNEKRQNVFFGELVDAIEMSIYHKVMSENVQFNCFFEEIDSLFTVPSYLYSIFYNLSSNSIKYRKPDEAPLITIKSRKLEKKVELSFKDNGKGIDLEKNASQLFGLYRRFDTSVEGKGMGLFMVKTQVEALGGTIEVKSKLGEGTEFIIQFSL